RAKMATESAIKAWIDHITHWEIPRYFGFSYFGTPSNDNDHRALGQPLSEQAVFVGTLLNDFLRPQVAIVAQMERLLKSNIGGGITQVGCGVGKTVIALFLMVLLGRKCAILVNNSTTLAPQWVDRIGQFVPGARVAFFGRKK